MFFEACTLATKPTVLSRMSREESKCLHLQRDERSLGHQHVGRRTGNRHGSCVGRWPLDGGSLRNSCRGHTGKIFLLIRLQGDVRLKEEGDCGKLRAFLMARGLSQQL
jgi:hypothetical protein